MTAITTIALARMRAPPRLCLAALLPVATACYAGSSMPASTQQRGSEMAGTTRAAEGASGTGAQWTTENKLARLQGSFMRDADDRTLRISYKISNIGQFPLLVFDRGDAVSVATKRQQAGSVGAPTMQFENGDLTLRHVALPLPNPAPTAPPSPLVTQVLPGGEYENGFSYVLPAPGSGQVRRMRYCQAAIGVPEPLPEAEQRPGGVWSVPNAYAAHQGVLCSPWLDLASGALVPEG